MDPIPPHELKASLKSVWRGWCLLGDREVVRESVAKGLYIPLAHTFISIRKQWDLFETKQWFQAQIRCWALDLLNKRQVFKARHILNNIELDPVTEFSETLVDTKDRDLRDFIALHLAKDENFDMNIYHHWQLLCALENYQGHITNVEAFSSIENVKQLIDCSRADEKTKVALEIFFKFFDSTVLHFFKPFETWKYLLDTNELLLLHDWIHLSYCDNFTRDQCLYKNSNNIALNNCIELIKTWPITEQMIDEIKILPKYTFTREYLFSQLSAYGIFVGEEDIPQYIQLLCNAEKLTNTEQILTQQLSTIKRDYFLKLLLKYCANNNFFNMICYLYKNYEFSDELLQRIDSKKLQLWVALRDMFQSFNSKTAYDCLQLGCTVIDLNIEHDLENHIELFLALILFDGNITLTDLVVFEHFKYKNVGIILKQLPYLCNIIEKQLINFSSQDITLYQMLSNYLNIDFTQTLYFRFKHNEPLPPNFKSELLIQRYSHREKLTFTYYLKIGRPSIAAKLFIINNFKKYGKLTTKIKHIGANLAHEIAIQNFFNTEIVTACISFTEMIGINSDLIRIHINICNTLKRSQTVEHIHEIFANFNDKKQLILDTVDNELLNTSPNDTADILTHWDVAMQFARIHNLKYPELYLKQCLTLNQWFEFLLFAQYHSYSLKRILHLSQQFKNNYIGEHISHALAFNLIVTKDDEKSPIENKKHSDTQKSVAPSTSTSSETNTTDIKDDNVIDNTDANNRIELYLPNDYYIENVDFIQMLVRCYNYDSTDRLQKFVDAAKEYSNPNFMIFAVCNEPKKLVLCWLIWICISIDSYELIPPLNLEEITPDLVADILLQAILKHFLSTLNESFLIFLPENPLCSFTKFLYCYCKEPNRDESIKALKLFNTVINYMKTKLDDTKPKVSNKHLLFLMDREWLATMSLQLVKYTLGYCLSSKYTQEQFLHLLIETEFNKDFPPDIKFAQIRNLLVVISNSDVTINLKILLQLEKYTPNDTDNELKRCIDELMALKHYDTALKICELENLKPDGIIVEEWKHNFETRPLDSIQDFWTQCNRALRLAKINSLQASNFFKNISEKVTNNIEKFIIIKLAYEWLKQCDVDEVHLQKLEVKMWLIYLEVDEWDEDVFEFVPEPCLMITTSEIRRQARLFTLSVREGLKTQRLINNFEILIGKLLDTGNIVQATRLEHMFNCRTKHLALIETCMKLAEGELSPYNLSAEFRILVENSTHYTRRRTLGYSSCSMASSENVPIVTNSETASREMIELQPPTKDAQAILERLVPNVKFGVSLAGRILCCKRVSEAISRDYSRVLVNYNAIDLLRAILVGDFNNKLDIANDIMRYHNWDKYQICEFLCAELVSAISKHVFKESVLIEPIYLWGLSLEDTMHIVLELCPEPSILGSSLLVHAATPMLSSTTLSALYLAGELLIRAHDCFTADCNVEGISKVLNRTRTMVSNLTALQAWPQIVRILTGLGRYNEMDYIFQILQENEQFEWLLGPCADRAKGLRLATLDYLRRRCPDKRELSRLVALRWGLHDSVAELWENEANEYIKNLIDVTKLEMELSKRTNIYPFDILELNNKDGTTKTNLENMISCFTNAIQHLLLASKYNAAQEITSSAELVALQLGLLAKCKSDRVFCIIRLNKDQYKHIMMHELQFTEAKILSTCYNYPTDWAQILFEQCFIKNNHERYLPAFLNHFNMTDVLAKDIVRKYLNDKTLNGNHVIPALRAILNNVKSITIKYRLASEVGLKDLVSNMLEQSTKSYLMDTVWKTGCPAPNV